ncbi:TRAP transporter small permease [Aureimonas glaciei]|uniref:TRAP transporter small permease protein n=1 Tax=Aureimonas glaciei TaxID=1776957 RepID=A0A916Y0S9_9HYPH|nr:TRAP transporter small permease [Aureimonas glaciei]GGD26184.1 ABC transporter permease [Aureimonas glaciei]
MKTIVDAYFTLLKVAIALLLAAMAALVFGNVVLRYGFNSGITVSEELSRLAFVWLIFLGAALALRDHAHIGIDTVIRALPPKAAKFCLLLGYLLMLIACALLIQGGLKQAMLTWSAVTPAAGVSMSWFMIPVVVFAITALLLLGYEAFAILTGRIDVTTAVLVTESEDHLPPEATRPAMPPVAAGLGR